MTLFCLKQWFSTFFIPRLSQTLLGNPKGPVKLGNPNTSAEVKLYLLFLFILAQEIVWRETEVLNTVRFS